ncbi:hypothetical protein L4G92_08540 [Neisseria sp. ZJ106]|nr:hypothetical protein [Neisseria lisongii]MCF7522092.1 hypothetical protein [Neisseria lisongii]
MNHNNLRKLHLTAARTACLLIATFWISTLISEMFLSLNAVIWVKNAIVYGVFLLMAAMAITGATGFKMGGKSKHPNIAAKQKRMPLIALNGLLILLPCAFYLCHKANSEQFDSVFYAVQGVELVAGLVNLSLMALSMKDGLAIRKRKA